jgi:hypothetical protein
MASTMVLKMLVLFSLVLGGSCANIWCSAATKECEAGGTRPIPTCVTGTMTGSPADYCCKTKPATGDKCKVTVGLADKIYDCDAGSDFGGYCKGGMMSLAWSLKNATPAASAASMVSASAAVFVLPAALLLFF